MKYADKLKDPRWQKKRLEVFERDEWRCRSCGDEEETLAVHHLIYRPKTEPWDYPNDLLMTLCKSCHEAERGERKEHEDMLLSVLKQRGFLANDIYDLVLAFIDLKMVKSPDVTVDEIRWVFRHKNIMKTIDEMYFDYLARREAKKKQEG